MNNFETLMDEILEFVEHDKNENIINTIKKTANSQRNYRSKHKYDLNKFGLTEKKIKTDCKNIYKTL